MPTYNVQYTAIYNCTEVVNADNPEQAVERIKDGLGNICDSSWEGVHPDTEFYVDLEDDEPGVTVAAEHHEEEDLPDPDPITIDDLPPVGSRVKVVGTIDDDPAPLPIGLEGTVREHSKFPSSLLGWSGQTEWQVWVDWDGNRGLALLYPQDMNKVVIVGGHV